MAGRRGLMWAAVGMLLLAGAAGCGGRGASGPQLVGDESLIPTVAVLPSVTPTLTATPIPTLAPPTPDFAAETAVALVTPTLPPTRTPTETWTPSLTPTVTSSPSPTLPPTQTPPPTPTPWPTQPVVIVPPPGQPPVSFPDPGQSVPPAGVSAPPAAADAGGNCTYPWFFSSRQPGGCSAGAAASIPAAYLDFERGHMIWLGNDRSLYVMYTDGSQPAWERYPDTYMEGMPERDPSIIGPLGLWQQPRRGFGNLWRTVPAVRSRLGWALHEWESSYTATFQQTGSQGGGGIYVTVPDGQIDALRGDQVGWERFSP